MIYLVDGVKKSAQELCLMAVKYDNKACLPCIHNGKIHYLTLQHISILERNGHKILTDNQSVLEDRLIRAWRDQERF